MVFGHRAGAVSLQQEAQIVGLSLKGAADIGLRNAHPGAQPFEYVRAVGNVVVVLDGVLLSGEGLVRYNAEAPGIEDQGVAGDTAGGLIGLQKPPSMTTSFPPPLMGLSPFLALTGIWPLMMWQWGPSRPNSFSSISHTAGS